MTRSSDCPECAGDEAVPCMLGCGVSVTPEPAPLVEPERVETRTPVPDWEERAWGGREAVRA